MKKSLFGTLAVALLAGSALATPTIQSEIVPLHTASGGTTRLPAAFWLELGGLTPSATYRYIHQAVDTAVDTATTAGAGNPMFVTASGDFVYTTSTSLSTAGQYGEFTTDATGRYAGWFVLVNTANARFDGTKDLSLRLRINDGAGGTTAADYLTTTTTFRPVPFGATSTAATGLMSAASPFTAKNFVLVYDNAAGTGRPLAATMVEDDQNSGAALGSLVGFYATSVDTVATAWGTSIPNNLPSGVRAIVERSRTTGDIVKSFSDADGIWPSGANTVNPTGGTTAITLTNPTDYPVSSVSAWMLHSF